MLFQVFRVDDFLNRLAQQFSLVPPPPSGRSRKLSLSFNTARFFNDDQKLLLSCRDTRQALAQSLQSLSIADDGQEGGLGPLQGDVVDRFADFSQLRALQLSRMKYLPRAAYKMTQLQLLRFMGRGAERPLIVEPNLSKLRRLESLSMRDVSFPTDSSRLTALSALTSLRVEGATFYSR